MLERVAFHAPETLTEAEFAQFDSFLHERWNAPEAPEIEWTTLASAMRAIAEQRALPGADNTVLDDIAEFIEQMTHK